MAKYLLMNDVILPDFSSYIWSSYPGEGQPVFNLYGQTKKFLRTSIIFSIHNKGSRPIAINQSSLSSDTDILTRYNVKDWDGKDYLNFSENQKSELYFNSIPLSVDVGKRSTVRINYDSQPFDVSSQKHLKENHLGQLLHQLKKSPNYEFKVTFRTVEGKSFEFDISFNSGD